MTRYGILMTYKIVGPILLLFILLEELAALGVIDLGRTNTARLGSLYPSSHDHDGPGPIHADRRHSGRGHFLSVRD